MKVSVVIPCYNVEKYISACLDSVLNQKHTDIEIICVDDGSIDNTRKLLQEFAKKETDKIQLIFQENAGAPSARNNGLNKASGTYIQFLDADDVLAPSKISSQLSLAKQFNMPDLIVGSYVRKKESGDVILRRSYNLDYTTESVFLHLMKTDLGITSSNLFHRRAFDNGLKWNKELKSSQEYDLMFELLKKSDNVVFDHLENTTIIDRESGSISKSNKSDNWMRYTQLRLRIFNYLKEMGKDVEIMTATQILFDAIRVLYGFQPEKAVSLYNQCIPKTFSPDVSPTTGKAYVKLFKLLGFSKTEKIRSFLS